MIYPALYESISRHIVHIARYDFICRKMASLINMWFILRNMTPYVALWSYNAQYCFALTSGLYFAIWSDMLTHGLLI